MSQVADCILLEENLKRLRLPTVLRHYSESARQARESGERYEDYLFDLTQREVEQRDTNALKARLREARFPLAKSLESTDTKKWPGLPAASIRQYAECDWISRHENLIFIGKHGTGKTHAGIVFGMEACRQGYRVQFWTAADLVNTLVEAREERQLKRTLARLARFALVIVDEVGYIPFSSEGAQLLFQIFSDRYERGSLLVTSNLPFAQWTGVFGEANLTAALLDRLTHHSYIHEFDWESIRLTESLTRKKKQSKASGE